MFHSLFNVSIFESGIRKLFFPLLMFGMTLRRRKFPANVRVHIHKSEKLIFVYFLSHLSFFTLLSRLSVPRPGLPELQTVLLDRQRFPVFRQRMTTL